MVRVLFTSTLPSRMEQSRKLPIRRSGMIAYIQPELGTKSSLCLTEVWDGLGTESLTFIYSKEDINVYSSPWVYPNSYRGETDPSNRLHKNLVWLSLYSPWHSSCLPPCRCSWQSATRSDPGPWGRGWGRKRGRTGTGGRWWEWSSPTGAASGSTPPPKQYQGVHLHLNSIRGSIREYTST